MESLTIPMMTNGAMKHTDQAPSSLRIALLAEGTYPYFPGGVSVWCDRTVRGLAPHRFSIYAIVANSDLEQTWELPENVDNLISISLWGDGAGTLSSVGPPNDLNAPEKTDIVRGEPGGEPPASPRRRRRSGARINLGRTNPPAAMGSEDADVARAFEQLATSLVDPDDGLSFLDALHQLFDLSQAQSSAPRLRTLSSVESLLAAMKSQRSRNRPSSTSGEVSVADALLVLDLIDRQLRPLFEPPPQVDLCHATSNGLAILPALGAYWSFGTPLVLSEHGIYLRERYLSYDASTFTRPVRATMLRFFKHLSWVGYQVAAAVAPVCDYNCQWLEANGCDPEQIRRIYNGVDVADIGGNGAEPEAPTLVWMGRIDPLKDVETLLKTFARVHREMPEARLRIFGATTKENQNYRRRCQDLASSLELDDSVTFEGHTNSVLEAYRSGHVVLLTSISEGFPYSLIEAMAAGKATVATDVGGVREATGSAGIVVPPQDPERMADACLSLLRDASLRQIVGRAARERILSRFTMDESLALYRELYREVTEDASRAPIKEYPGPSDEEFMEELAMQLIESPIGPFMKSDIDAKRGRGRRVSEGAEGLAS